MVAAGECAHRVEIVCLALSSRKRPTDKTSSCVHTKQSKSPLEILLSARTHLPCRRSSGLCWNRCRHLYRQRLNTAAAHRFDSHSHTQFLPFFFEFIH